MKFANSWEGLRTRMTLRLYSYLCLQKPQDCYQWDISVSKRKKWDAPLEEIALLEFEGFDIYKFYNLLLKSNMNVMDWLFASSPYKDCMRDHYELESIVLEGFDRNVYIRHNYSLCKSNYHQYFVKPAEKEPTIKRYVYCIRAILSARYCYENDAPAPIDFYELLKKSGLDEKDKKELRDMVELKKKTKEKHWYKNVKWCEFIQNFLNSEVLKSTHKNNSEEYYGKLNDSLMEQLQPVSEE